MLWPTILIALLITIPVLIFVVWPLFFPSAKVMVDDLDESRLAELVQRKDAVLQSIKELEFDLHTSKISQADFQLLNTRLRHQAIGLMRQIDKVAPEVTELEEALEKEIMKLRRVDGDVLHAAHKNGKAPQPSPKKAVSNVTEDTTDRFCRQCGARVNEEDRFCAKCGAALKVAAGS
ncbi:MAG: zinc ribbon domain-containing protein [Caldilineaceae bacterium]|nr:zinc ribbon domain-containing protein [Caldilineaceae bacterium]